MGKDGLADGSALCPYPDCVAEIKASWLKTHAGPEFPCPRCTRTLRKVERAGTPGWAAEAVR